MTFCPDEETLGTLTETFKSDHLNLYHKAAAHAYRDEIAPQTKNAKFWDRQNTTFRKLWEKFEAHELIEPNLRASTIADYKAIGRLYLLPLLGHCRQKCSPVTAWLAKSTPRL